MEWCGDPVPLLQSFVWYFNYSGRVFAVLFWSKCYFDIANFLPDLLVFTLLIQCCMTLFAISPFSIKFTPFCNYRIKMQYRNDFWECIKPALVKLNQQVLQSFKDKRCNNYIGDMLLMTLLRCWLIFYLFITWKWKNKLENCFFICCNMHNIVRSDFNRLMLLKSTVLLVLQHY